MGTALIVIIPEGVETLYNASDYTAQTHARRSTYPEHGVLSRRDSVITPSTGQLLWPRAPLDSTDEEKAKVIDYKAPPGPVIPEGLEAAASSSSPPKAPKEPGMVGILESSKSSKQPDSFSPDTPSSPPTSPTKPIAEREPHAWIGLSLIFGFILMYLLDTLPFLAPPAPSRPQSNIYSLSDLSASPVSTPAPPQRTLSTTLGLCIHAAADGIALGASSSSTSTKSLSLIIFVAIMVHKAPAAFGLTSVLLKQGLGKRGARAHLVIFSLAAPAGAIATWILVRALGGGGDSEPAVMKWWTGVLLLFSGGTFL